MNRTKTFIVCLVMATLCAAASGQAPTASELLQKGIYLEETVGDLEGAMRTYKQVTQLAAESRASAAQAEYRMGVCLQKKGQQAEAINTFRNLIKEFPEQADVVAKARESLPAEAKAAATALNPCQELEDLIASHPEEAAVREKAAECYLRAQVKALFTSDAARELEHYRVKHALWLVQHVPDKISMRGEESRFSFPEDYARLNLEWTTQIQTHPDNANVLANAAQFALVDDREKATEWAVKAHNLDPANLRATHTLAQLLELGLHRNRMNPELKIQTAQRALQLREQAWNSPKSSPDFLSLDLKYMAQDAFDAGEYVKAQKYGEQLSLDNDADSIHRGNVILGRLALKNGNVEEAKKRLLAAGKSTGSPGLGSFGPSMSLALEFLQKGEQDVVLQYFDECQEFWQNDRGKLEQWRQAVHQGRIPDFGGNLFY